MKDLLGCLVLLMVLCFIVAHGQILFAMMTIVFWWLLLTAILLIPTWLTTYFLEQYEEGTKEDTWGGIIVWFGRMILHVVAYGVVVTGLIWLLAEFPSLTQLHLNQLNAVDWVLLFIVVTGAATIATIIVMRIKSTMGRTPQRIFSGIAALVLVVTATVTTVSVIAVRINQWQVCERDSQWLTQGVDFRQGEIDAGKVNFLFYNRLANKIKAWVIVRASSNGIAKFLKGPYECEVGECRLEATFSSPPDFQNQYLELSFDTGEDSNSLSRLGFLMPYQVLYWVLTGDRTVYQVVEAHCNLFNLERQSKLKAVGTVTLR